MTISTIRKTVFLQAVFAISLFILSAWAFAAPVETVTNTDDSGAGSLRDAIANVDPGGTIEFNLPGAPPHTIALQSGLVIDKPLTIEGPGADLLEVTIPDLPGSPPLLTINDMITATKNIVNISGISFSRVGPVDIITPGGISNFEDLTISYCVLSGFNAAFFNAGGFSGTETGALLEVNNCTITNSIFGIFNSGGGSDTSQGGIAVINKSTFTMNLAGISNNGGQNLNSTGGQVTVNNSNFFQNDVGISGSSGLFQTSGGSITILNNSTVSGNSNGVALVGGSMIFGGNTGGAVMTINNSTIANNQAEGIELVENLNDPGLPAVLDIKNSIVGDNGTNCVNNGTFTAFGDNLDTDGTCAALSAQFTQVTSMALNLGPLQDNGGPTDTHALIPPSAAIDGAPDCTFIGGGPVAVDQRFFPRPFGGNCDIGAFEEQPLGMLTVELLNDPPGGPGAEFTGEVFPMGCALMGSFFLDDTQSVGCVLPLGIYTIEEMLPDGFITEIACNGNSFSETPTSVTIDLGDGDNVFCTFINLELSVSLSPLAATNEIFSSHTVTATALIGGEPLVGAEVVFEVISGPNQGETSDPDSGECTQNDDCTTDEKGEVSWTYTSELHGTDTIVATLFAEEFEMTLESNTAQKTWIIVRNIPTMSEWGMITTAALLGLFSLYVMRRRLRQRAS